MAAQAAITDIRKLFSIESLKNEQIQMIEAILEKRDVLAVLPTGYGKSLPYQMYVPLRRKLSGDDYRKQSMTNLTSQNSSYARIYLH